MGDIERIRAGLYRHMPTGRYIVRTDGWHGPRGGKYELWEHAREDKHAGLVIDGYCTYRTLRDAVDDLPALAAVVKGGESDG